MHCYDNILINISIKKRYQAKRGVAALRETLHLEIEKQKTEIIKIFLFKSFLFL